MNEEHRLVKEYLLTLISRPKIESNTQPEPLASNVSDSSKSFANKWVNGTNKSSFSKTRTFSVLKMKCLDPLPYRMYVQ